MICSSRSCNITFIDIFILPPLRGPSHIFTPHTSIRSDRHIHLSRTMTTHLLFFSGVSSLYTFRRSHFECTSSHTLSYCLSCRWRSLSRYLDIVISLASCWVALRGDKISIHEVAGRATSVRGVSWIGSMGPRWVQMLSMI